MISSKGLVSVLCATGKKKEEQRKIKRTKETENILPVESSLLKYVLTTLRLALWPGK